MVGGAILYREVIQREISRVLALNLSGEKSGASALHRRSLPLTEPSLLSRGTLRSRLDAIGRATRRVRSITVQFKSARQGLPHNFPSRRPIAIPDSILRLWNYSIRVEALVLVCFG